MNKTIASVLILISFLVLINADSNGIWNLAQDIKPGIFGSDEDDNTTSYIFENPIDVKNNFNVSGENISLGNSSSNINLNGNINLNAENITLGNDNSEVVLNGKVTVNAENITLGDDNSDVILNGKVTVNGDDITIGDSNSNISINGNVKLNDNNIATENFVTTTVYTKAEVDALIASLGGGGTPASPPLVFSQHSEEQCIDLGGVVFDSGSGNHCKFFSLPTCPIGWAMHEGWSKTTSETCTNSRGGGYSRNGCNGYISASCTTGGHTTYSNIPIESCSRTTTSAGGYCGTIAPISVSCTATVDEIGCY